MFIEDIPSVPHLSVVELKHKFNVFFCVVLGFLPVTPAHVFLVQVLVSLLIGMALSYVLAFELSRGTHAC